MTGRSRRDDEWHWRYLLAPGRLVPIAAPLLATVVLWWSFLTLSEGRRWELHTYQVLRAVSAATQAVDEVVLRQQGFMLTGDEAVLDAFQQSIGRLVPAMQDIADLTTDNPRQQAAIAAARPLLHATLGAVTSGVAAAQAGDSGAPSFRAHTAAIESAVQRLRAAFDGLAQEERRLLAVRTKTSAWAERLMALGGLLTGMAFLASLHVAIFRRRRGDRHADQPQGGGRLAVREEIG